ncbi:MAG: EAL domain-containing protein, partial [Zoogloeaceae bacterium]|nr:EAL domain-containing protein [Zoogloeaceae bacterium]
MTARTPASNHKWRKIFLLALVYFGVGSAFVHLFAPNSGYVASLFPSAGIALGALLVFGMRLWPGVWLGDCMLQLSLGLMHGTTVPLWVSLFLPLFAVLQAAFAYWLARRLIKTRRPLENPHYILRFILVAAPVACVLGAFLSCAICLAAGLIQAENFFFDTATWWLSNTIGMITFTPIMLVFFARPREYWRTHRANIVLPLCAMLLLISIVFIYLRNRETQAAKADFARESSLLVTRLHVQLEDQANVLFMLGQLVRVHRNLSDDDWRSFIQPWMTQHPATRFFAYSPWIEHGERDSFEAGLRGTNPQNAQIRERDDEGRDFPAAPAKAYLPYIYAAPEEFGKDLIGLNAFGWRKQGQQLLKQAADDNLLAGMVLMAGRKAIVLSHMVHDRQSQRPSGLVTGAVLADDLVSAALDEENSRRMELCIADRTSLDDRHVFGQPGCEQQEWREEKETLVQTNMIYFAGKIWEIRTRANSRYPMHYWGTGGWVTHGALFLMMILQSLFLMLYAGRAQRAKNLARQRTLQLRNTEHTLSEQTELLLMAQRIAHLGSWEQKDEHLIVSDELCRMFNLQPGEISQWWQLIDIVPAKERAELACAFTRLQRENGQFSLDCHVRPHGEEQEMFVCFYLRSEIKDQERCLQGVVQNLSAQRSYEDRIHLLTYYDLLTHLPNHTLWLQQISEILAEQPDKQSVFAILAIDINAMTSINNSLGRAAGDTVLAEAARRMKGIIPSDAILARQTGDEFSLCLPDLPRASEAAVFTRNLLAAFARAPVVYAEHKLALSASIGIALYPEDGRDIATLQKNADIALDCAKTVSKGGFQFFEPRMTQRAVENLMLENALRQGIQRDELILFYQPQIGSAKGNVPSCEALVRWRHPDIGLISPAQFIPLAEDSGLIIPLGQWVFTEACRQQVRWANRDIVIAVNVSAVQFLREDFVTSVENILMETGADPRRLELEITESALMQLSDSLIERIYRLKGMGFELSLDDFGTGYSSLSYLKRLPIARLKLDQSFVANLPHDPDNRAITTATLLMANELNMDVVAEGVETQAQMTFLKKHGCAILQGFLFGRPMSVPNFESWLQDFA